MVYSRLWTINFYVFSLGNPFEPIKSALENCRINLTLTLVVVECDYPRNSVVTGFQVVIEQGNVAEVDKIFVGQATDRQSRVTVEVEMDQRYPLQVAVITTREGTGNVEYVKVFSNGQGVLFNTTMHYWTRSILSHHVCKFYSALLGTHKLGCLLTSMDGTYTMGIGNLHIKKQTLYAFTDGDSGDCVVISVIAST